MSKRKKKRPHGPPARRLEVPAPDTVRRTPSGAASLRVFLDRGGLAIVGGMALLYFVLMFATSMRKYGTFSYHDYDLAIYNQVVWNTLRGDFFYSTIRENEYQMPDGRRRVGIYFKDHMSVILLVLLPAYALWPGPEQLLLWQALLLGAAAVPLYLIARRELNAAWGLLLAAAYLIHPAIGYMNLFEFHPEAFVPFFLLFALWFFQRERFWLFVVFIALALFCRESVAITIFMVGVWALIRRRSWRWAITPAAMGLAWFVFFVFFLNPAFNESGYPYTGHFADVGGKEGVFGVIKDLVVRPGRAIAQAFRVNPDFDNPGYLVKLFLPLAVLPVFGRWALLIVLPELALNLLSSIRTTPTIYFQYNNAIVPVLFFASVLGVQTLCSRGSRRLWLDVALGVGCVGLILLAVLGGRHRLLSLALLIPAVFAGLRLGLRHRVAWTAAALVAVMSLAFGLAYAPQTHLLSSSWQGRKAPPSLPDVDRKDPVRAALVKKIPDDAGVTASFDFLPALSNRRYLYSFHKVHSGREKVTGKPYVPPPVEWLDYALLDFSWDGGTFLIWGDPLGKSDSVANVQAFYASARWGVVDVIDSVVLFKRDFAGGELLWQGGLTDADLPEGPRLDATCSLLLSNSEFAVELVAARLEPVQRSGFSQLRATLWWRSLKQASETISPGAAPRQANVDLELFFAFSDGQGKVVLSQRRALCYLAYPARVWKPGEVIREVQYFLLPSEPLVEPLRLLCLPVMRGEVRPWPLKTTPTRPDVVLRDGWIVLGTVTSNNPQRMYGGEP